MKVFWSWQNDYSPKTCRHFIREALNDAIGTAGEELGLEDAERPEIDHDTKDTAGMAEITRTILEKISRSAVFVADVTPIAKTDGGKALPNPNVMIELGWAMSELGTERIIVVLNEASGWKPDDLPFDIRHRRAMTYNLEETADAKTKQAARKTLTRNLADALRANLGEYIENKDAIEPVAGVAAKPDNPSIWATAGETLEHNDSMGRGHKTSVILPDCPRGYIRIIPASWRNGVPSVHDIKNVGDDQIVWPPSDGASAGNYGVCEEGFVHYMHTGTDDQGGIETRNVSMFFDETGEFWILHGTAIREGRHGAALGVHALVGGWARAMHKGFAMLDRYGASPVRKVEAGLTGMRGVRWPGQWQTESPPARKDHCVAVRQNRDWSEEARLGFLTDAYNKVRDLYGFPRAAPEDTRKLLSN
ncbi:hypothetical protein [Mesorhizobium sp.]|uniref:hypothetical protein n=2 Tax=Mesorhizobium sp. TaxID=1871066 RepID=UPI0025EF4BE4|nr:hypothetical protein [Mesorhizobium sp.]